MILVILNICVTVMLAIKFWLNPIKVWKEMSFQEFQDGHNGSNLGYRNETILAILNLCVTVMPPIKFWLNRTWFGRRCRLKNFKMAAMAAILDIGTE